MEIIINSFCFVLSVVCFCYLIKIVYKEHLYTQKIGIGLWLGLFGVFVVVLFNLLVLVLHCLGIYVYF